MPGAGLLEHARAPGAAGEAVADLGGSDAAASEPRWLAAVAWGFIAFGILLRVRMYFFASPSLFLDEVMLALNIDTRGFIGLLSPLGWYQMAPVGFLWATEAVTLIFGVNEWSLRLIPLAAGIASLVVFYLLMRRLGGGWGGVVAVALLAVSRNAVYYTVEFKPYGLDLLACIGLLLMAIRVDDARHTARAWIALGVTGLAALLMSFTSVLILATVGIVLLVRAWRSGASGAVRRALGWSSLWAVVFLAFYFLFYSRQEVSKFMHDYWESAFLPVPPRSTSDVGLYLVAWFDLFQTALDSSTKLFGNRFPVLLAPFFLFGLGWLVWTRRLWLAAMLAMPIGLALVASALGKYPFTGRMILFTAPLVLAAVGVAADALCRLLAGLPRGAAPAALLVGVLLMQPFVEGLAGLVRPQKREGWQTVLAEMKRHAQPGDVVFRLRHAAYPWDYYAPKLGIEGMTVLEPTKDVIFERSDLPAVLQRGDRVWVIARSPRFQAVGNWRDIANEHADPIVELNSNEAWAALYQAKPPGGPGPDSAAQP